MINLQQINAIVVRHLLLWFRDMSRILDLFFWPILNVCMISFISIWLKKAEFDIPASLALIPLAGALFWEVLGRTTVEVCFNLLEELWSNNTANLFATPLTFSNYLIALYTLGLLKAVSVFTLCSIFVWFAYGFSAFIFGWKTVLLVGSLILSGFILGTIACSMVITWGRRVSVFCWALAWVTTPFSGSLYPIDILPQWMQVVSQFIPMSYVFKVIHQFLKDGTFSFHDLAISYVLNAVYLILVIILLYHMFERSKQLGLTRLGQR